jgi:hypothetical protein
MIKLQYKILRKCGDNMGGLVYDELSLVDSQMYKYDKFLHSRINKYTDAGRTIVIYFNINDANTSTSLGMETHYQIIGIDSPLRYDKITNMILVDFSPLAPNDTTASTTNVRNYDLSGEAYVLPNTIMPKENDFFIIKHLNMNNLFRVTKVVQDGMNTDGSYQISYVLHSTSDDELTQLNEQVVGEHIMDLQTIGGEDLTPIISKTDHELRSRLMKMVDDMIESYTARFYNVTHNCFLCNLDGVNLFDLCGNMFMARHGVMMRDNANGNIVLNSNKIIDPRLDDMYQKSPYKWIERDAPYRYLDTFKYYISKGFSYIDSTFARYGDDVDIMIPADAWCPSERCDSFFPLPVHAIFENEQDIRNCTINECRCGECCNEGINKSYKLKRYDYVSIIHDFIHGKLTSMEKLSLYTGDQLFDNSMSKEVYLWTPIIIYIIKQTLKIK